MELKATRLRSAVALRYERNGPVRPAKLRTPEVETRPPTSNAVVAIIGKKLAGVSQGTTSRLPLKWGAVKMFT